MENHLDQVAEVYWEITNKRKMELRVQNN